MVVNYPFLNSYKIMWMYVMFDLPVVEKEERDAATKFRNCLLDMGFQMAQFSVYYRSCGSKEWLDKHKLAITKAIPPRGKVNILYFTDKQFTMQDCFYGDLVEKKGEIKQLLLF